MFIYKCAKVMYTALACSSLLLATNNASAANLPCVQRWVNWNSTSGIKFISFSLVALHSPSNIAAYSSTGKLVNCPGNQCLKSQYWVETLISDRSFTHPNSPVGGFGFNQPFDVDRPILIWVDSIPNDSAGKVRMHQAQGSYAFTPRCVGNMLVGDDQYGNHWTMGFKIPDIKL
ncbi:exported hypothetical protein [Crenothrix polyspora]|uniref:Secreted protein n=1 Tax=Crenothrix polyspora TaxID=360316 RepID=A0A1R4H3J5_9GAMM|nr:hypothetical protein [Crenothrix polyspora]SJM90823.1 exported hypothetical protein [Crenothrix polyspora]